MTEQYFLTRESFTSKMYNFFNPKNLVIFLGKKGVMLASYRKNQLLEIKFIAKEDQHNIEHYVQFLKKYKKYHINFLIDLPEVILKTEILSQIQVFLKNNPANRYIAERYNPEDIVAYNVINIAKSASRPEAWQLQIASCSYNEIIVTLLSYITTNSLKFNGFYFLLLEYNNIFNYLRKISLPIEQKKFQNKQQHKNYNQVLVLSLFITEVSELKIVALHKNMVMEHYSTNYPIAKTDDYRLGFIEQVIEEMIFTLKSYIKQHQLEVNVVLFCNNSSKNFFSKLKFENCKYSLFKQPFVENKHISQNPQYDADELIMRSFNQVKCHKGTSSNLQIINILNYIGSFIAIPFLLILICLLVYFFNLTVQNMQIAAEASQIRQQVNEVNAKYRLYKQNFLQIEKYGNVADYISAKAILSNHNLPPVFDILDQFKEHRDHRVRINKLFYSIDTDKKYYRGFYPKYFIKYNVELDVILEKKKDKPIGKFIDDLKSKITSLYKDYKVTYQYNLNTQVHIGNKIFTKFHVELSKQVNNNAP